MTRLADVRAALAEAVQTGSGLRCYPYLMDTINAPCAFVERRAMDPRMVFGQSKAIYPLQVRVFLPRDSERQSQIDLDELADVQGGERSLIAAVQDGDNWPDNLVDYVEVVRVNDTALVDVGGVTYITTAFDLEVCW